jgi:hypothetical protein
MKAKARGRLKKRTRAFRERAAARRPGAPRFARVAEEHGIALIAALLVVVMVAAIVVVLVTTGLSGVRAVSADYHNSRTLYGAEAGAEAALSQIEAALDDGVLTDDEIAAISPPALEGFDYDEFHVSRDGTVFVERLTDGPFTGLYSLTQKFTVISKASDQSGALGGVALGGKAQAIPVFQFGWFFGGAGSFGAGATWDGYGRAHANGDLHLIGCDSYFHEPLTTPGRVHRDGITQHRPLGGGVNMCPIRVYIDDESGNAVFLSFDSDDTPDPEAFKAKSAASFDSRLMSGAFGVDSLKLPLPEGVPPREIIRPRDGDDTDAERNVKYSWLADMYVAVDLAVLENKNQECDNSPPAGAPAQLPKITVTRFNGYTAVPDDATKCAIFRFRWESFFDNHEEGWVDVLDVDIAALKSWIDNVAGEGTEIIYVDFQNASAAVQEPGVTDSKNPAGNFKDAYHPVMKIINGAELPGPLTLGSARTVYVQGDYNTINWKPSAVFADVWGQLSNAWDDGNVQDDYDFSTWWCRFQVPDCPPATNTEQNHAVLVGSAKGNIDCFHEDLDCPPVPLLPSGLPYKAMGAGKMLEAWRHNGYGSVPRCPGPQRRCTHTWRGSVVALWAPETSSLWYNAPAANYYYPPIRDHAFDTHFENPDSLPPGTPVVGQVFRASFREVY